MKKRFAKIYLEITNLCNLSCSFCHGTARPPKTVTPEEFRVLAEKLVPYTDYLYLHVLGEPLLHPELPELLRISDELGFRTCLTTNGTLLRERQELLLSHAASSSLLLTKPTKIARCAVLCSSIHFLLHETIILIIS